MTIPFRDRLEAGHGGLPQFRGRLVQWWTGPFDRLPSEVPSRPFVSPSTHSLVSSASIDVARICSLILEGNDERVPGHEILRLLSTIYFAVGFDFNRSVFSASTTKAMAELFRNKIFSVALPRRAARLTILSNPRKDPLLIKEMARGCRDGKIQLFFASRAPSGRSRRFATECDSLRRCDDLRQNTAYHGVARQRGCSATPPMRQFGRVVEHKGNV